jgi:hypothetical protein
MLMLIGRVSMRCNDAEKTIIRMLCPSCGVPVLGNSGN